MLAWLVVHLLAYSSQSPVFPLLHIVSCLDPPGTCKKVRARDQSAYVIFFTIARGRPRGGAGIVRQIPYLSPQLSPGGGGGAYH